MRKDILKEKKKISGQMGDLQGIFSRRKDKDVVPMVNTALGKWAFHQHRHCDNLPKLSSETGLYITTSGFAVELKWSLSC